MGHGKYYSSPNIYQLDEKNVGALLPFALQSSSESVHCQDVD